MRGSRATDESLRAAFETETILFLDSVLRDNRSVLDLITASYTFVNAQRAKHYGIPSVEGGYFRQVELPQGGYAVECWARAAF